MATGGSSRGRWTLKEIVQGKPWGHPSHAMFVHFPIAFYVGAFGFDVLSRVGRFPEAPLAASWLILAALAGVVPAALTGLVDWWGMVPGSSKRRVATRHFVLQVAAASIFALVLALRWGSRGIPDARTLWIALEAAGLAVVAWGQWLGGVLVYRMGMRVSTSKPKPASSDLRASG